MAKPWSALYWQTANVLDIGCGQWPCRLACQCKLSILWRGTEWWILSLLHHYIIRFQPSSMKPANSSSWLDTWNEVESGIVGLQCYGITGCVGGAGKMLVALLLWWFDPWLQAYASQLSVELSAAVATAAATSAHICQCREQWYTKCRSSGK